ncbi:MAG: putative toxin-antitoxin system toxin component, PIN family [Proteobacteria bacterium]|nr:putative toxin-antitoxin system toxin component, PIN family [Pseudomonadota bacterium]
MKVVLDTNVLMSAIFWKGLPGKILEFWSSNLFTLVITEEIFAEFKEVAGILQKRYKVANVEPILNLIAINAHFIHPLVVNYPKCTDPDDDKFIAAAVSSKAKYIVTGDKALLKVAVYEGGKIVTPKEFVIIF